MEQLREKLYKRVCHFMDEYDFERTDSEIGSYEKYCKLQKEIIDNASDEDIQFWVMVNNKFVGKS